MVFVTTEIQLLAYVAIITLFLFIIATPVEALDPVGSQFVETLYIEILIKLL
jgi:hypothetical protein